MENAISTLRIQNFKSIKDVTMAPRRVNLLIGMPNVGKSNILEAMSLLGGIWYEQTEKFMGSFIRYEEPRQMFYDNIIRNTIKVETNCETAIIGRSYSDANFKALFLSSLTYSEIIHNSVFTQSISNITMSTDDAILDDFERVVNQIPPNIKGSWYVYTEFDNQAVFKINQYRTRHRVNTRFYNFNRNPSIYKDHYSEYLYPPFGDNLINVIQTFPRLRKEMSRMFESYKLKLQLRIDERRLEVVKDLEGIIYSYPYSSIADTLQRIIFYLAAIESNDDAVILLEEPEAHSYPTYVSMLGRRIVASRNNQFFVATHSPYLITEILEQMLPDETQAQELAIFVAYYEDYQTKVKQLSDEEVRAIRADGLDVFYNMARFIPRPVNG